MSYISLYQGSIFPWLADQVLAHSSKQFEEQQDQFRLQKTFSPNSYTLQNSLSALLFEIYA